MTIFRSLFVFALCAPVFAQSDGIAVTASRTVDLSPDQITFTIAVMTDTNVSLDQVLQATQSLGLTVTNLSTLNLQPSYGPGAPRPSLAYVFTLSTSLSKFSETNDKLNALRRSLTDNTPPMDLQTYSTVVSPSDNAVTQARQGLRAQLIADANQQGQQLAKAAGVNLGAIVALNEFIGLASNVSGPYYGPYGPSGPSALHTTYSLSVRYAVK